MRAIPYKLEQSLTSGVSTLARCWRIERRDGAVLGFTDHDRTIVIEAVAYEPDSGFAPGASESATGLAVDTHEIEGALRSDRISDDDIVRGLYDGADIALWLVDWQDQSVRLLLSRGQIGSIRRGESAFEAEVTGLTDRLNQPIGRAYLATCDARLGDGRCGVDLSSPTWRGSGGIAGVNDGRTFTVTGLDGYARGWFSQGLLRWQSGGNEGLEAQVKAHRLSPGGVLLELWLTTPMAVAVGDAFEVTAGCDKSAGTCRAKFANMLNFRGFPHMPGDDHVASYPTQGGAHDGGSLQR